MSKFNDSTNHHYGTMQPVIQRINFHTIKSMDNCYAKQLPYGQTHQNYNHKHQEQKHEQTDDDNNDNNSNNNNNNNETTFEIHNAYKEKADVIKVELNEMVKQKPVPFVNTNIFVKRNNKSIF